MNIAAVGVGGMGRANLHALASQNIVALCDVDWSYVDARFADIPKQIENAQKRAQEATDAAPARARAAAGEGLAGAAAEATEGKPLHRLPRDAREAEEHRRGGDRARRITPTR